MDADPHLDLGQATLLAAGIHPVHGELHGKGAGHGTFGVVGRCRGCAENHEHPVTHDLIDGAAIVQDQVDHRLQIAVQKRDGFLRREALGQGCKAAQV